MSDNVAPPSINSYAKIFAAIYLASIFALIFINIFFDMLLSAENLAPNMASFLTVNKFITENRRAPDLNEKRALIWMSIGIQLGIHFLLSIIFVFLTGEMIPSLKSLFELSLGLRLFTFLLIVVSQYFCYWLMYGWIAKFAARKFK